jgi:cystathionine beta-lyase
MQYAIQALTKEGDNILIQTPVYTPFYQAIEGNNRIVIENKLINNEERYEIDFDDLDKKMSQAKLMIFCSPHNPIGRV